MKLPLLASLLLAGASAWGEEDRVRLDQVDVITLTRGAWTTGRCVFRKLCICILYASCYVKNVFSTMAIVRRSSPVAQLACVGGSARLVSCPTRLYFN